MICNFNLLAYGHKTRGFSRLRLAPAEVTDKQTLGFCHKL